MWDEVKKLISDHTSFLITTHVHPDGDAIGSEVALAHYLRGVGKEVVVVNSSRTPGNLLFLDPESLIKVYPDDYDTRRVESVDVVIVVDVNNWGHVGPVAKILQDHPGKRICIDHHQGEDPGFADVVAVDSSAAATGILVYELIGEMKGEITRAIADAVYTAIITDTGTFRFSNTNHRVFGVAMDLMDKGVEPFAIGRKVFSKTVGAVKLLGTVLSTLEISDDARVAWVHVTQKMFEASGARYEDSDGLVDVVRAIKHVAYVLFFKETRDGKIKVSLRSNGKANVHAIAQSFGGGGHKMAAGMAVDGPMDKAIERVTRHCLSM